MYYDIQHYVQTQVQGYMFMKHLVYTKKNSMKISSIMYILNQCKNVYDLHGNHPDVIFPYNIIKEIQNSYRKQHHMYRRSFGV